MANKNPMAPEPLTPAFNHSLITAALTLAEWPSINLHDRTALQKRTRDYFLLCDAKGMRPSNLGLYAAWGMSRQDVSDVLRGTNRTKVSPDCLDIIEKAKFAISCYREQLALQGKVSPPIAIFWAKNFDQMADYTVLEVSPKQATDHLMLSQEELQKRIPVYSEEPEPTEE